MEQLHSNYKARYSIFGWIVGDALGSTLEFCSGDDAKQIISKYHNFEAGLIGGGPFGLVPGQFTDDTELGLANMSVIIKFGRYDQKTVAQAYHVWYQSGPFDIGKATQEAVSKKTVAGMINASKTINSTSLSNGFLMRLPGLVALYDKKTDAELIRAVTDDVVLTHGHPEVPIIAGIYSMMLRLAIKGKSAYEVYQWGRINCGRSRLITSLYHSVDQNQNIFQYDNKIYNISQIDTEIFGFVGFAVWLLLRCLQKFSTYREAILNVVSHGGDTDTNACIVGAIFGALYPQTIPTNWIISVMSFADSQSPRLKTYPIANPRVWANWLPQI